MAARRGAVGGVPRRGVPARAAAASPSSSRRPCSSRRASRSRYDATIAVVADDELRAERVAGRDMAELGRREARQLPQAEKARRAGFVVANDGTVDELRERLRAVLAEIAS